VRGKLYGQTTKKVELVGLDEDGHSKLRDRAKNNVGTA
jgi:hypothetical protein